VRAPGRAHPAGDFRASATARGDDGDADERALREAERELAPDEVPAWDVHWAGPVGASSGQFYATVACSLLIGLGGAFTLSSEVDPAQAVLQAAPKPFWRTPILRVGLWLIVGTTALLALAWYVGRHCCLPASTILAAVLPDFLLACSLCFFVASFAGSYVGGAIGLSSLGGRTLLANLWARFPVRPFDLPDAHTWPGGPLVDQGSRSCTAPRCIRASAVECPSCARTVGWVTESAPRRQVEKNHR
jgi:hypothetical protein